MIQTILAWTVIATSVGCAAKPTAPTPRSAVLDVPIVYSSYFDPQPLTAAQRSEINAQISEANSRTGDAWFLYVSYSRDGIYRITVYLKPTVETTRVRRGEEYFLDNERSIEKRRAIFRQLGQTWPTLNPYVQLRDKRSDASTVPVEANLPFYPPDRLSEEDLVQVIEVARAAAVVAPLRATAMPVREISVEADGTVQVLFGGLAGPSNGGGISVKLKRDAKVFTAIGTGMWVS